MSHFYTSGFLFGRKFRNQCIAYASISAIILGCFLILLWYDLMFSENFTPGKFLAVAVISGGIVCLLSSGCKRFQQMSAKYVCDQNQISNVYMREQFAVNWGEGCFMSRMPIAFFIGKGSTAKTFLIISKTPIPTKLDGCFGIDAIEKLLSNHAVLLPWEGDPVQWLTENVGMESVPSYPNVVFMPARPKDLF